jgi:ribonuclease PH
LPLVNEVAAISVGIVEGVALLDLKYEEDVAAAVDCNVVLNGNLDIIEVQGTAEEGSYSRSQLNQLLDLAESGIQNLLVQQRQALVN